MSVALSITPDANIRRVEQILQQIAYGDIPDLLDEIGGLIVDQVQVRFQKTKRRPDGSLWSSPRWTKKYREWRKRKKKTRGRYLVLEGHLQQSIQHLIEGRDTLQIGSNLDYARAQQLGMVDPPREYLGLSSADVEEIEEEVIAWMRKLMR